MTLEERADRVKFKDYETNSTRAVKLVVALYLVKAHGRPQFSICMT